MEIYAWVVTLPLCFRRFYMLTMPTHQKITHGWLECNAAQLKIRHLFSHLQVHKISSHTSHKCLYSEAAPIGGLFNASRRLGPRGCVMGYKKSPASWQVSNLPKHPTISNLGDLFNFGKILMRYSSNGWRTSFQVVQRRNLKRFVSTWRCMFPTLW